MNQPYLQEIPETGETGGVHVLFAARVQHWPFARLIQYLWTEWESDPLQQLLERQLRFLHALHPGSSTDGQPRSAPFTIELRYISRPSTELVDCVLLGKVFSADLSAGRQSALALWETVFALLPLGYTLQPAQTAADFDAWSGGDIARQLNAQNQWAEVRRPAEYMLWTDRSLPARRIPIIYPFGWQATGWETVWLAQMHQARPNLVAVSLRPTVVPLAEEMVLADLTTELHAVAAEAKPPLAQQAAEFAALYKNYLCAARMPYTVRVLVLGAPAVRQAVRSTLSDAGWHLGEAKAFPLAVSAETVEPATPADWQTAQNNFARLEQAHWGPSNLQAPFLDRMRYLTDAAGALCAFRLPLLARDNLPGLAVGADLSPRGEV